MTSPQHDPRKSYIEAVSGIEGAAVPSPLFQRIDLVEDELARAEMVTYEMVRRLEPVLPPEFGQRTALPPEAVAVDPTSPLTIRIADLAARAGRLVRQLQGVCEAVDL